MSLKELVGSELASQILGSVGESLYRKYSGSDKINDFFDFVGSYSRIERSYINKTILDDLTRKHTILYAKSSLEAQGILNNVLEAHVKDGKIPNIAVVTAEDNKIYSLSYDYQQNSLSMVVLDKNERFGQSLSEDAIERAINEAKRRFLMLQSEKLKEYENKNIEEIIKAGGVERYLANASEGVIVVRFAEEYSKTILPAEKEKSSLEHAPIELKGHHIVNESLNAKGSTTSLKKRGVYDEWLTKEGLSRKVLYVAKLSTYKYSLPSNYKYSSDMFKTAGTDPTPQAEIEQKRRDVLIKSRIKRAGITLAEGVISGAVAYNRNKTLLRTLKEQNKDLVLVTKKELREANLLKKEPVYLKPLLKTNIEKSNLGKKATDIANKFGEQANFYIQNAGRRILGTNRNSYVYRYLQRRKEVKEERIKKITEAYNRGAILAERTTLLSSIGLATKHSAASFVKSTAKESIQTNTLFEPIAQVARDANTAYKTGKVLYRAGRSGARLVVGLGKSIYYWRRTLQNITNALRTATLVKSFITTLISMMTSLIASLGPVLVVIVMIFVIYSIILSLFAGSISDQFSIFNTASYLFMDKSVKYHQAGLFADYNGSLLDASYIIAKNIEKYFDDSEDYQTARVEIGPVVYTVREQDNKTAEEIASEIYGILLNRTSSTIDSILRFVNEEIDPDLVVQYFNYKHKDDNVDTLENVMKLSRETLNEITIPIRMAFGTVSYSCDTYSSACYVDKTSGYDQYRITSLPTLLTSTGTVRKGFFGNSKPIYINISHTFTVKSASIKNLNYVFFHFDTNDSESLMRFSALYDLPASKSLYEKVVEPVMIERYYSKKIEALAHMIESSKRSNVMLIGAIENPFVPIKSQDNASTGTENVNLIKSKSMRYGYNYVYNLSALSVAQNRNVIVNDYVKFVNEITGITCNDYCDFEMEYKKYVENLYDPSYVDTNFVDTNDYLWNTFKPISLITEINGNVYYPSDIGKRQYNVDLVPVDGYSPKVYEIKTGTIYLNRKIVYNKENGALEFSDSYDQIECLRLFKLTKCDLNTILNDSFTKTLQFDKSIPYAKNVVFSIFWYKPTDFISNSGQTDEEILNDYVEDKCGYTTSSDYGIGTSTSIEYLKCKERVLNELNQNPVEKYDKVLKYKKSVVIFGNLDEIYVQPGTNLTDSAIIGKPNPNGLYVSILKPSAYGFWDNLGNLIKNGAVDDFNKILLNIEPAKNIIGELDDRKGIYTNPDYQIIKEQK